MNKRQYLLAILITLATLVGCSVSSPTAEVSSPTAVILTQKPKFQTVRPSITLPPTQTETLFSPTITPILEPSATLLPTQIPGIIQNCIPIKEEHFPLADDLNGIIAIQSKSYMLENSYLLNLYSGELYHFPNDKIEYLIHGAASPNGEHFAYIGTNHPNADYKLLIITTPTGLLKKEIDLSAILQSVKHS